MITMRAEYRTDIAELSKEIFRFGCVLGSLIIAAIGIGVAFLAWQDGQSARCGRCRSSCRNRSRSSSSCRRSHNHRSPILLNPRPKPPHRHRLTNSLVCRSAEVMGTARVRSFVAIRTVLAGEATDMTEPDAA